MFIPSSLGFLDVTLLGGAIDPDTQAIVERMTVKPDATRILLIDQTVLALKAAGIWSKLDALWIIAAHDAQAASLNWISSNFTLVPVNSPTFTPDRDYAFNGTTSYIDTMFNPFLNGVKFTQNSANIGVWSRTAAIMSGSVMGWFNGNDGVSLRPRTVTNTFNGRLNSMNGIDVTNLDGTGMYAASRGDANDMRLYKNGSVIATDARPSLLPVNGNINIGRITNSSFVACTAAMGWVGADFTDSEHAAFRTIINNYMTAVGAA